MVDETKSAKMPRVWISKLVINDGSEIELSRNDTVIFVGPNNAGKSVLLKEIHRLLQHANVPGIIAKRIEIAQDGSFGELKAYLETTLKKVHAGNAQFIYQGPMGFAAYEIQVEQRWKSAVNNGLEEFRELYVSLLSTEARLSASNPAANISLTTQPATHPIHLIQKDETLEDTLSGYFRQAFGSDLTLHRNAGNLVPFYVGERPKAELCKGRLSPSFFAELEKLPTLQDQGDGMRSFVGVLLSAFISSYSILLIDEPEAFLHPPQARLLGKMLSKDLPSDRQLFLATHSEDFLKGLLDSGNKNVKAIRIVRENQINRTSLLDKNDISAIWSDSLLRHSNVLNGLFHKRVVICEGDADCRFYSAVLDSVMTNSARTNPDILFVHCGGKDRMPVAVKALGKLNVDLKVVVDIDIFNGEETFREIVTALKGNWDELRGDWKIVKKAVDEKRPELDVNDLHKEIDQLFSGIAGKIISKDNIEGIQKLLKMASPWSHIKAAGKVFLPSGQPTVAFNSVEEKCRSLGLLILDVGELESFVKSVGNHGPKWINKVLEKRLEEDPELEMARRFVERLL